MLPLCYRKGRTLAQDTAGTLGGGLPGVGLRLPGRPNTCWPWPLLFPDATTYAHFLFNAFDADGNGAIRFEVGP